MYASRSNLPEIDYWNFCEVVVALERFGDLLVAGYAKASSSNPPFDESHSKFFVVSDTCVHE